MQGKGKTINDNSMFDFFKKKIYLRDLLEDFHDIHSHLLWGVDDGSPTQKATDSLADEMASMGFSHTYLTPHIIYGCYGNHNEESLRARFAEMTPHNKVEYRLAAEYFLDEKFLEHIQKPDEVLTLADKHILVEYGLQTTRVERLDMLFEAALQGFQIIVAHPERYAFAFDGRDMHQVEKLTNKGYALQLNLPSLLGSNGSKVKRIAEEMLLDGRYTFVGSDTHSRHYTSALHEGTLSPKVADALKQLITNNKEILWK